MTSNIAARHGNNKRVREIDEGSVAPHGAKSQNPILHLTPK